MTSTTAVITEGLLSLNTLVERLQKVVQAESWGNANLEVGAIVHPRLAVCPACMVYAPDLKALQALEEGPAKTAVVALNAEIPEEVLERLQKNGCGLLKVERPRYALALLSQWFDKPAFVPAGIHPTAVIDPSATLETGVTVGPYAVVGPTTHVGQNSILHAHVSVGADCELGEGCLLHAGARVGDRVTLGKRVILQPNACIGSDGYSYVTPEKSGHEAARETGGAANKGQTSKLERIQSLGTVVLEDDVEVGACACIDRGTLAETRIRKGTKIDNLVQIGHNNQVGEACLIVSQVGLSGSCTIGNRVVLAGQAGLADHLTVGDDALVMAKSGVMTSVEAGSVVGGIPAQPRRLIGEQLVYLSKLKTMHQSIKALEKQVAELQKQMPKP
jgi:UDP-3-O-[3-hydroxymyristoyl] glucosamine N-acyltransferase